MKIFYRVYMVERGRDIPMQLVSIGMVREDEETLYLINADSLGNAIWDKWLSINIWPYLPARAEVGGHSEGGAIVEWDKNHQDYHRVMPLDSIADHVLTFLRETVDKHGSVELWSHNGAFDHVVLTQLFGNRGERPSGMPSYTNDLAQILESWPVSLPLQGYSQENVALTEAAWIKYVYDTISKIPMDSQLFAEAEQLIKAIENEPSSPKELT